MSEEEVIGSQVGNWDNIDDINSVYKPYIDGYMGSICLAQVNGN